MRIVIQRVSNASVTIGGQVKSKIGKGYLILLGIESSDNQEDIDWLVKKIVGLRVFDDAITFKIALMVVKYMKYIEKTDF